MKIRLLAIMFFIALLSVFFCGCSRLDETNNQNGTNKAETTSLSASDIADDNTASSEKEDLTTSSDNITSNEYSTASTSETTAPAKSEAYSEPEEICTSDPKVSSQGEPEVNFSDLM